MFPPVSNYRRFLIHSCVGTLGRDNVSTFSIGLQDERRTVVCYSEALLSDVACAKPKMGLTSTDGGQCLQGSDGGFHAVDRDRRSIDNARSTPAKPRRPDRAVYVPRALRSATSSDDRNTRKRSQQSAESDAKSPKEQPQRDKSAPGTPRRSIDKTYCNVYTPPHLRNQRSQCPESMSADTADTTVPNNLILASDDVIDNREAENFYIGDYFVNGQLGFYDQPYYSNEEEKRSFCDKEKSEEVEAMAQDGTNIISENYLGYSKDVEDYEKEELKRASQEMNRGSKRLIKQSFDSDVLVISDPIPEPVAEIKKVEQKAEVVDVKPKAKLEAKVSLKREENDWDAVFDDSGECLDPSLLEELTATVGKVRISKAKNNYESYQTKGQVLCSGPCDETFAHVLEVYDFPSEFKTNDLLSVFSDYKDTGFEIRWVDDTHALIVFSSAKIAAEVMLSDRPLVRCRPLHAATLESRNKAKKCAEFLQPYRQRPETCTALARRLVSGALGVKLSTAREERDEERRLITRAREKKRQAALHKEAAWEGSLTSQHT